MNTGQSIAVGWGALLIGAGGAYLYVRQEIDERHRTAAKSGRQDNRILTWDERLALDAELEAIKLQTKTVDAVKQLSSHLPSATATTDAIKEIKATEGEVYHRKSYLDPDYGKKK